MEDGQIDHQWMSVRGIWISSTAFHAMSSKRPSSRKSVPTENTTMKMLLFIWVSCTSVECFIWLYGIINSQCLLFFFNTVTYWKTQHEYPETLKMAGWKTGEWENTAILIVPGLLLTTINSQLLVSILDRPIDYSNQADIVVPNFPFFPSSRVKYSQTLHLFGCDLCCICCRHHLEML